MFKNFSRSVRETVERRLCFFKPQKLQGEPRSSSASVLPSCTFNCDVLQPTTLNLPCGAKRKQRERRGRNWRDAFHLEYTGLGFIGWGTALLMGWYVGEPVYRRRIFPGDVVAQPQPQPVLRPRDVNNVVDGEAQPYGPLTAEQALDRAADDLLEVQKKAVGDIANRLGVHMLRHGRHREGVAHLCSAAHLGHAAASFNLALCYEKGLGLPKDLVKAAKYYSVAAARRHPSATFNLGVFYAHGWGGLRKDPVRARELVLAASQAPHSTPTPILHAATRLLSTI